MEIISGYTSHFYGLHKKKKIRKHRNHGTFRTFTQSSMQQDFMLPDLWSGRELAVSPAGSVGAPRFARGLRSASVRAKHASTGLIAPSTGRPVSASLRSAQNRGPLDLVSPSAPERCVRSAKDRRVEFCFIDTKKGVPSGTPFRVDATRFELATSASRIPETTLSDASQSRFSL